jgi:fumarate hydratase subunit beta
MPIHAISKPVKSFQLPLSDDILKVLHSGDELLLTGVMYVGRDAAHKRLIQSLFPVLPELAP